MTADLHYHPLSRPLSPTIESPPTTPQKPILNTNNMNTSPDTGAAPFGRQGRDQAVRKSVTWDDLISYRTIELGIPDTIADVADNGDERRNQEGEVEGTRLDTVSEVSDTRHDEDGLRSETSFSYTIPSQGSPQTDEGLNLPPLSPDAASTSADPSDQPKRRRLNRPRSLILGPKDLFLRALTRLHIGPGNPTVRSENPNGTACQTTEAETNSRSLAYNQEREVQVSSHAQPDFMGNRPSSAVSKGILNRRADDQVDRPGIDGSPSSPPRSFPHENAGVRTPRLSLDDETHRDKGKPHRRSYSISFFPSGSKGLSETNERKRSSWIRKGRKEQEDEQNPTETMRISTEKQLDIFGERPSKMLNPDRGELAVANSRTGLASLGYPPVDQGSNCTYLPPCDMSNEVGARPALCVQGAPRRGSRRTVSDPTVPTTARLMTTCNGHGDKAEGWGKSSPLDGKDRHTIVRMLKDEMTLEVDGKHVPTEEKAEVTKASPGEIDGSKRDDIRFDDIGKMWDAWSRSDDLQRSAQRRRAMSLNKDLPRLPILVDGLDGSARRGDQLLSSRLRKTTSGMPAVSHPQSKEPFQAKRRTRSLERHELTDSERTRSELSDKPSYTVMTRAATPMSSPSSFSLLLAPALLSQQASRILLELSTLTQASEGSNSAQANGGTWTADSMAEFKQKMEELARESSEAGRGLLDSLINAHAKSSGEAVGSIPSASTVSNCDEAQHDIRESAKQSPRTRWVADSLSSITFPR